MDRAHVVGVSIDPCDVARAIIERKQRATLCGEEWAHVKAACHAHGLAVRGAWRVGVMLVLEPETLDDMPGAEVLRQVAEALAGDGVRYVALSLEEGDEQVVGERARAKP